jgi:2-polyprenyl-3-methyl-5-hydroxy-6-metoxy-1,4-benzoquinol methylase
MLPDKPYRRSLLDIGSGPGFLVLQAHKRGWRAFGEEPSKIAIEHADRLGVCTQASFRHSAFDCITATEVLEHLDDPLAMLRRMHDQLNADGMVALSVPNDENPLQRLFGSWIAPPGCDDPKRPWRHHTHKHYFNPKSLKALVESAGFEVVWQRTSFPVELLLAIPFLSRKLAWKLSRLWPAPPFLWRFGIGRHCLLVARKVSS